MTPSARDTILTSVAAALGPGRANPEADYQTIDRTYELVGTLDKHRSLDLFIERLREYGANVTQCASEAIAATIAERIRERGQVRLVIPHDLPSQWLPTGLEVIEDHDLTYDALEHCDGAITGCAAAIADTGTIILDGSARQGRRAITLLPDYHLCVVFEQQVFETVPQAIHALSEAKSLPLTFISGPSATADIEMTRIQGVHGPRSMDVVLVS